MDYDDLDAEDLYDLSFEELVTMAKEKPRLTANLMWQLLWGPWVPQRVGNEMDGEAFAIEVIDDPGTAMAAKSRKNNSSTTSAQLSADTKNALAELRSALTERRKLEQDVRLQKELDQLELVRKPLAETKPKGPTSSQPSNSTLSAGMRRILQEQLSVVTELAQTDKGNSGRWGKERAQLERLLMETKKQ